MREQQVNFVFRYFPSLSDQRFTRFVCMVWGFLNSFENL